MVDSRTPFWSSIARGDARVSRALHERPRGHLRAGLPGAHRVRPLDQPGRTGDAGARSVRPPALGGATIFNSFFSRTPTSGRALLREIRSSFYRKLRLAFWAASVVPVIVLALATRAYFATELTAGIEEAAARTATVAQRLVEDYAALQQRGAGGLDALDDDIMGLVSRAIDEDVNLFDGASLQATSALDLYASQLLSTRTPAEVYRRLVLERAPTYVGEQDVGAVRYLVAAAPAVLGGRHRDGPDHAAAHGDRAADRRARPARAVRGRAVQPARAGARLLDGRAHRRPGQPAHARNAADCRVATWMRASPRLRPTSSAASSRISTRWPPTSAGSAASSNARSGWRPGPTWRGRSRTTSRTR